MLVRSLTALLALAAGTFAVAADDYNPYKTAKVGDYAKYTVKAKAGGIPIDANAIQTLTAKTDEEATLKFALAIGDVELKAQEVKVDLTKPFDPSKSFAIPSITDLKLEKMKEGEEKVKAGGKEYSTTWTSYKVTAKSGKNDVKGEMKVWLSKETSLGVVKLELIGTSGKNDLEVKLELQEAGSKK